MLKGRIEEISLTSFRATRWQWLEAKVLLGILLLATSARQIFQRRCVDLYNISLFLFSTFFTCTSTCREAFGHKSSKNLQGRMGGRRVKENAIAALHPFSREFLSGAHF